MSRNESLLYRSNKSTLTHTGKIESSGLYEVFDSEINKKDFVYQFPVTGILGITQQPKVIFPNKNKNILSCPDIRINKVFKELVGLIKESCSKFNLSYEANRYYLSSSISDSHNMDFWNDQSSASRPALFGILCLEDSVSNIKINETVLSLGLGDIVISEAGNRITYLNSFKSLDIQVMPLSELKGQPLERWIPLS